MTTKDIKVKKGVLEITLAPDCPMCVEEFFDILAANEIYDYFVAYPICKKHFEKIVAIEPN